MAEIRPLALEGVHEILPTRYGDARGWFAETWNRAWLAQAGIDRDWCQDNEAWSQAAGVLRGMHFQRPPFAQAKLVRCVQGRIFDVAVDIRAGSADFGGWVGVELSADAGNQLLVPRGFAHGYLTLEPGCLVAYKVDAPYARDAEAGFRFDDPAVAIAWPGESTPTMSDKDRNAPFLAQLDTGFGS